MRRLSCLALHIGQFKFCFIHLTRHSTCRTFLQHPRVATEPVSGSVQIGHSWSSIDLYQYFLPVTWTRAIASPAEAASKGRKACALRGVDLVSKLWAPGPAPGPTGRARGLAIGARRPARRPGASPHDCGNLVLDALEIGRTLIKAQPRVPKEMLPFSHSVARTHPGIRSIVRVQNVVKFSFKVYIIQVVHLMYI
jgi:hypothetical protein